MNQVIKDHLLSALQTFLGSFFAVMGAMIKVGAVEWTVSFWGALLIAAAVAAIKEVMARFAPTSFGGRVGPTLFGRRG